MKLGFYPNLAKEGIRKNKKLYVPYIMTCVMMVLVYYILSFLSYSPLVTSMHGGDSLAMVLGLGKGVIFIFSILFLIYTNSFLIRRRKKEFGLYNVLGMSKKNISLVLFWETVIVLAISLFAGLFLGVISSKFFELVLMNVIEGEITYGFSVDFKSIWYTVTLYTTIQGLILIKSITSITLSNPIELVKSGDVGEKKPKVNWLLGIAGFVILGIAYYLAVTIKQPLTALILFFVAVVLVIVATYLLMISGSVLVCYLLQKNEKYYYNKKHFVSVSSMRYRMRRNGAGLASICILITMVLVMISSTSCLFFGSKDSIESYYPRDWMMEYRPVEFNEDANQKIDSMKKSISNALDENNLNGTDILEYRDTMISGVQLDSKYIEIDATKEDVNSVSNMDKLVNIHFISVDDYNKRENENIRLHNGEALVYTIRAKELEDSLTLGNKTYSIVKHLDDLDLVGIESYVSIVPSIVLIVDELPNITNNQGSSMMQNMWIYGVNLNTSDASTIQFNKDITNTIYTQFINEDEWLNTGTFCEQKTDFFSTFGGFFFLGCVLSVVFMMAAVLIIYYKQICEGYEDESRFEIMQKIGMTKEDIKKSINSQMLTIFMFPLLLAVLHIVFAFPMIQKLIRLFNIYNEVTLIQTTCISVCVCSILYIIVYKITSNTYYNIVSGEK